MSCLARAWCRRVCGSIDWQHNTSVIWHRRGGILYVLLGYLLNLESMITGGVDTAGLHQVERH